jgi:hypothetical protein
MTENFMSTYYDENYIVIKIPIDLLVFAEKNREDSYNVTDKLEMAKYIAENIIEFSHTVGQQEIGSSDFTDLLDRMFTDAYESAETWLDYSDIDLE